MNDRDYKILERYLTNYMKKHKKYKRLMEEYYIQIKLIPYKRTSPSWDSFYNDDNY